MLVEDVQPHGPPGLYADLVTIQAVGQHLDDLIHDLIPTLTDPAKLARDAAALTKLRHDLLTLDQPEKIIGVVRAAEAKMMGKA